VTDAVIPVCPCVRREDRSLRGGTARMCDRADTQPQRSTEERVKWRLVERWLLILRVCSWHLACIPPCTWLFVSPECQTCGPTSPKPSMECVSCFDSIRHEGDSNASCPPYRWILLVACFTLAQGVVWGGWMHQPLSSTHNQSTGLVEGLLRNALGSWGWNMC
jgi:hypothetical protein